ncbi:hypothetical protein [Mycobacterium sp. 050134]|uniref:hypothetical protein n=1 Tax=Mycobacterium sp. 050134 TaxID=3096111 RepID=UPI002EDB5B95
MPRKDIDRVRATAALDVIRQHPVLVLFAASPALALVGAIWWVAGAGWAILSALAFLLVGAGLIVMRR